jgi:hypothetical protein
VLAVLERERADAARAVVDALPGLIAEPDGLADPAVVSLINAFAQRSELHARVRRLGSLAADEAELRPRLAELVGQLANADTRDAAARELAAFERTLEHRAALAADAAIGPELGVAAQRDARAWAAAWADGDTENARTRAHRLAQYDRLSSLRRTIAAVRTRSAVDRLDLHPLLELDEGSVAALLAPAERAAARAASALLKDDADRAETLLDQADAAASPARLLERLLEMQAVDAGHAMPDEPVRTTAELAEMAGARFALVRATSASRVERDLSMLSRWAAELSFDGPNALPRDRRDDAHAAVRWIASRALDSLTQ